MLSLLIFIIHLTRKKIKTLELRPKAYPAQYPVSGRQRMEH